MASKQPVVVLPPPTNLFPSPLRIRKKSRRASRKATFYRRIIRKSPQQPSHDSVYGPLDDIITEISSDIWASPSDRCLDTSLSAPGEPLGALHDYHPNPFKAASTCTVSTVTPLPVSRIPSDQPLTIRKNRSSRSTTSEPSATHPVMAFTHSSGSSRKHSSSGGSSKVRDSLDQPRTLWPQFDAALSIEHSEPSSSNNTITATHSPAQQALEETQRTGESKDSKRHTPRSRLLSNAFNRLLRSGSDAKRAEQETRNENGSVGPVFETAEAPKTEAVEAALAYMSNNGRNQATVGSIVKQVARGLPSPLGNRHEQDPVQRIVSPTMPTTLKTMITVLPEVKLLESDNVKDFWVGVEIEGVLHHRRELPNPNIDVVFIVDNGYYVSKECLTRALDTAIGALHQLGRGDRVALYTTHCTHGSVASTVPDMLLPLRPVCQDTEDVFRDLTLDIAKHGIQDWDPPRPTPPMKNVISAIANSLENESPEYLRCHMILLSPIFDVLHAVSESFPNLRIHQINPAILPFIPNEEHRERVCLETCCKNVFVSNWAHYQSAPTRLKQIMVQARSETPLGEITDVHVDLRPKSGCEVLEIEGPTNMSTLRPGQTFSFLAHIRVFPSETKELGTTSSDPLLDHSLDATNLRQELYAADRLDAKLTHLLSVQVFHKNTLLPPGTWSYTECPLVVTKKLGRLAPPHDVSLDVYKLRIFYMLSKVENKPAKKLVDKLAMAMSSAKEDVQEVVERMAKEVHWHQAVLEYEASSRQKLPLCTHPIEIASSEHHEHIQAMLDAKMNKRKGMAVI